MEKNTCSWALSGVGKERTVLMFRSKIILVDESIELLQTFVSSINNNEPHIFIVHTYRK